MEIIHQDHCELNNIKINFGKCTCGAERQAEISFKAGIKEVVEWINNIVKEYDAQLFFEKEWQAKLKEWRIE